MREMLEKQLARYDELERMMSDPGVLADSSKIAAVAREHGSLSKVASKYRRFKDTLNEISDLKKMAGSGDSDERDMAAKTLCERVA
jgi:peptide chain release factor 1